MRPVTEAGIALARLDERIARSPVGEGFLERMQTRPAERWTVRRRTSSELYLRGRIVRGGGRPA
ncbi:hypothetical protein E0H46_30250 [Rhizobium leguminosarum bv. viciae]|nr:hypothetical protein E0H46_30250 [Rhizobium leguminosarum bv. viciae]